jgi:hypothetical protein
MSTLKVDGIRSNSAASDAISLDSNGRVGIGTSSPGDKLHVNGTTNLAGNSYLTNTYVSGNIYLGGTGSANAFDDYEEGTWTPALNLSATYTTQSGIYVKIGRLVHVEWALSFNSLSGSGYPFVSGLPYNVVSSPSNPIPLIRSQDAQPIELRQQPHTSYGNGDKIYVRGYDSSGNAYQPGGGTFWNNGHFNGTMTYYTTT